MLYGRRPVHRVIPFLLLGFYNRIRQRKTENQGVPGFYLGLVPNYPEGTIRFLDGRTRHVIVTRDVKWLPTEGVMVPELGRAPSRAPKTVEQGRTKDLSGNCDRECSKVREQGDS